MLKQIEGSQGIAEATALCRPQVVCACPITPQTHIVEGVGAMVKTGTLQNCEFINVESGFATRSAPIGASAAGARAWTATASQGLWFMAEAVYNAAGQGHQKQIDALAVIAQLAAGFEAVFGRTAGGLVRPGRTEGAETVVVPLGPINGTINGTIKDVVDAEREAGSSLGSITIASFRPFPLQALGEWIAGAKRVVCVEKSLAKGLGGMLASNIRMAMQGSGTPVHTVIADLGGRPITRTAWTQRTAPCRPRATGPTPSPRATAPVRAVTRLWASAMPVMPRCGRRGQGGGGQCHRLAHAMPLMPRCGRRGQGGGGQCHRLSGGLHHPLSRNRVADPVAPFGVWQCPCGGDRSGRRDADAWQDRCAGRGAGWRRVAQGQPSTQALAACRASSNATMMSFISATTTRLA